MNTDKVPDLNNVESTWYLLKEETHRMIVCAFEVLTAPGHGLYEKIYRMTCVFH